MLGEVVHLVDTVDARRFRSALALAVAGKVTCLVHSFWISKALGYES